LIVLFVRIIFLLFLEVFLLNVVVDALVQFLTTVSTCGW
jgi:hypothetical protein